jgi:hypothetical protein
LSSGFVNGGFYNLKAPSAARNFSSPGKFTDFLLLLPSAGGLFFCSQRASFRSGQKNLLLFLFLFGFCLGSGNRFADTTYRGHKQIIVKSYNEERMRHGTV